MMFKKAFWMSLILVLALGSWGGFLLPCFSQGTEKLTITTYYPSPFGVYNQLVTRTLGVGDNNVSGGIDSADAPDSTTNPGDLWVAGKVGIGTTNPEVDIDIKKGNNRVGLGKDASGDVGVVFKANTRFGVVCIPPFRNQLLIKAYEGGSIGFQTYPVADGSFGGMDRMIITKDGNVGIGTTSPAGRLDVNGTIYQRGGLLHADYVFDPDYKLETIKEHAEYMWKHKHLKAVSEAKVDKNGQETVEIGAYRRSLLEELEKAHIYIYQLNERIEVLEKKMREK